MTVDGGKTQKKCPSSTKSQHNYIEMLSADLEFDIHRRNAHISNIIEREIKYLDELNISEASRVITQFKEWKDKNKEKIKGRPQENLF